MTRSLTIYNSLTRKIEPFETIEPAKVRMYVCGVTPYAAAHIGHAMSLLVFDVIRRYLEYSGYEVAHVQNFTDIDDKIIVRANREGIAPSKLTEQLIAEWHNETASLGVLPASAYPQATLEIPAIVEMVSGLIEKGHAYEVEGDVYFRVRTFKDYGKLSRRSVDEMISGARIEVDERKEDPLDFALWKSAKPGEPHWDSPWSEGRPGWHIECSAMCSHHLDGQVDIHGGGTDLVFPHHENEIAQSEAFLGVSPFARYWVHNGLLQLGGDKMSKSIGNIVTVRELLETGRTQAFRLMILQSHYRSPLTHTDEAIEAAQRGYERLRTAAQVQAVPSATDSDTEASRRIEKAANATTSRFHDAMDHDFDSPQAVAALFDFARDINRARDEGLDQESLGNAQSVLVNLAGVLGLTFADAQNDYGSAEPFIELLLNVRENLRTSKQWDIADQIRGGLAEQGITIKDGPQGATWEKS